MSSNEWSDIPAGGGNYAKWAEVGDTVAGEITSKFRGTDMQGNPCPAIVVRADDGSETTISASQAMLKAKMIEASPQVGDRIKVAFVRLEKRDGGKTLKHFEVTVKKAAPAIAADDF